ncbi:hypothetical protein TREMEDRAFT_60742 [Tremella mesenterica DSM 1558]|uniref:uncharacterized protein n=1 Tax=Tremella mesenterica (strain ATCC 24925 / CBS 8224 / DSM 1558 / NBRC 9311 / NRRL Y-6157 / RJB 2259-6 / UBC 559-6) TaxID=578456 RepID=UPI0003F4A65B|nr:uncharacterized protein TREMEDRAFT_60742 [Tremella mesenterica DSM 1558]EIW71823.1 hypothetical protein TREMEDRAFT_60742 [Tremella mesenterica DSM 1558]
MSSVAAYTLDPESFTSTTGLETLEVLFEHYFPDDIQLAGTITSLREAIWDAWEEGHSIWESTPQGWPGEDVDAATYFEQYCEQIGPQDPYDYYEKGKSGSPYHILACLSEVHDVVRKELDTRLQQKLKSNLEDLYVRPGTMSFSCREFWAIKKEADAMFDVTKEAGPILYSTRELTLPSDVIAMSEIYLRTAEGVNKVLARMMSVSEEDEGMESSQTLDTL